MPHARGLTSRLKTGRAVQLRPGEHRTRRARVGNQASPTAPGTDAATRRATPASAPAHAVIWSTALPATVDATLAWYGKLLAAH
ncbi:hypothetical protein [Streptomyces sp. NPDC051286]|uniref:hypothetical protein n=1 Tax=Streptomyces sp. NPDC051286 TaxID=3365647 RepID=UPI0037AB7216